MTKLVSNWSRSRIDFSPRLQRHKQILTPEQHNEGRCQHTQNGEQVWQVYITCNTDPDEDCLDLCSADGASLRAGPTKANRKCSLISADFCWSFGMLHTPVGTDFSQKSGHWSCLLLQKEPELNHTSSSALPSSSTIRDDEEKASFSRLHPNKMKNWDYLFSLNQNIGCLFLPFSVLWLTRKPRLWRSNRSTIRRLHHRNHPIIRPWGMKRFFVVL